MFTKKNLFAFFAAFSIGATALATTITATGSGWCNQNNCNNTNTSVINNHYASIENGTDYRDWFAFDLSSQSGNTIIQASLNIYNSQYNRASALGDLFNLVEAGSITYSSLVGGPVLGSVSAGVADTGINHFVTVTLNANGLAALNATGTNPFIFGGSTASTSQFFGYTGGTPIATLDVTSAAVPEPTTVALLGLGLLGVATSRRKAAKK